MTSRFLTRLSPLARLSQPRLASAAATSALRITSVRPLSATSHVRFFADAATATPAADAKPADGASSGDKVAELTKEMEKKDAQIKELNDKWMRALAEQQNILTRSQNQLADSKKFAVQSFAKSLLEIADILEIATKAAEPHAASSTDANFKNLFEGVGMTQKVLLQVFERNGLKKFEPLNEKFDPYFHEGLLQMEDATKTPGTVGLVLKSGYKLHERCLRAAQVGTVKAPAAPAANQQ